MNDLFCKKSLHILLFFLFISYSNSIISEEKGLVVAFAGLSGSGKTTMAKTLGQLCSCCILNEPEESDWPEVITKSREFGYFSMWMGFRQLWLPHLYEAQKLKEQNQRVILDSYFVKIIGYELLEPGMEWLFPKDDPYFQIYKQICHLDIDQLPDPDCIILFDVSLENWIKLLDTRNRAWDKTPGFIESYEHTKRAIQNAVERICKERDIQLIHFKHEFGDILEQANRLKSLLIQNHILHAETT